MNKISYSKRGIAIFSALLICAILLSLTLTNLFSSKAEETAVSDQANGKTPASEPFSSTTNTNDNNDVTPSEPSSPTNANNASAQPINDPIASDPVPGQIVIQFSPNSSEQERAAYVESLGGTVVTTIEALDTVVLNVPEKTAQEPLPASPIVEQAEQSHFVSAFDTIKLNDPKYASQWALSAINAPSAWVQIPANTPIVTVAVIDTGICPAHEDLVGRIGAGYDFIQKDSIPQDENGHGCFVSGLIAANMNNGIGIAGVAPNTRIMPLRVLDASGRGTDSNVAAAIIYAADNGAQIINLSLGGEYPSLAMENAVNYAAAKGVSVVAAAGNKGALGALYPAKYAAAIAVGSLDSDLRPSYFSNYGPDIDIWAPGGNVMSTNLNGGYGSGSGTSFAAPYVSGAIALDLALNQTMALTGENLDFNNSNSFVTIPDPADDASSNVTIASTPGNDNFAAAININDTPEMLGGGYYQLDTTGATTEAGDPWPSINCISSIDDLYPALTPKPTNFYSVWYQYTPSEDGTLHVDTQSGSNGITDYDTLVAVWDSTFTEIACNNDVGYITSLLNTSLTSGTTYYIEVIDIGKLLEVTPGVWVRQAPTGGRLHLNLNFSAVAGSPVPNDDFINAVNINDSFNPTTSHIYTTGLIDTRLATKAISLTHGYDDPNLVYNVDSCVPFPGAPTHPSMQAGQASVWYKYTPVETGPIRIDTVGSNYDTILSILEADVGSSPANPTGLPMVGCNDDFNASEKGISGLRLNVYTGKTYYINVAQIGDVLLSGSGFIQSSGSGALDNSGDVSAQYFGGLMTLNLYSPAPFGAGIYDDNDVNGSVPVWLYTDTGDWNTYTSAGSGPYANTDHYSKITGKSASFNYYGIGFVFKYAKNYNRGNIKVYVDDALETTINANSASLSWQNIYISKIKESGFHTVKFEHAGPDGTYIDIDSIQIIDPVPQEAGVYDDSNNNAWNYGGDWTSATGKTGPLSGTRHYTTTPDNIAAFSFTGAVPTKFILTYAKMPTSGSFQVYVDNMYVTTVNAYSATTLWKQTYTSPSYSSGTHTVILKHAGASGKIMDVDAIQILELPEAGATIYDDRNALWTYTGTWKAYRGAGPLNSTRRYTATLNGTAAFSFIGPAKFALYYTKTPTSGKFQVYVDGALVTTINAYSATTRWKQKYSGPLYSSGIHTVTIKNIGPSGKYIDVDAIQIVAISDTIAPSAITDLAATEGTDPGTVNLSWTAPGNDGTSGAATSYLVRYSAAPIYASNWASATAVSGVIPAPTEYDTDQTMTVTGLTPGITYYFAVRAQDTGPNLGGMSSNADLSLLSATAKALANIAPAVTAIYDDRDANWYRAGAWTPKNITGPYLNTRYYTSTLNSVAAFAFTGPAKFTLYYAKTATSGKFQVYVDNALVTTINAYSATTLWKQTYTSPLYSSGTTHTVVLKNITSGKNMDVDAIQIVTPPVAGATVYDDRHALWTYTGTWTSYSGSGPLNNTRHYSATLNGTAAFPFTGDPITPTRFTLTYTKTSTSGSFEVYVDGVLLTTVNAYNASTKWKQTYTSPFYYAGVHTVTLKNIGPSGKTMDVDAIRIDTTTDVTPPSAITDLAAAGGTNTGEVILNWKAPGNDDGTPPTGTAASYLVRYSTALINASNWDSATAVTGVIPTPAAYDTDQSMTVTGLTPGVTYYFAVRALDSGPNLGDVSNSPSVAAQTLTSFGAGTIYDDRDANWYRAGAWTAGSGSGPYLNTRYYTTTLNATATFSFAGPAKFILTYSKMATSGKFQIYVDGAYVTTISAYNATTLWKQTYTSSIYLSGTHTVVIKNIVSGKSIDVDAIQILEPADLNDTLYDDDDVSWTYPAGATWASIPVETGPYDDTQHRSTSAADDRAEFTFTGPASFALIYTKTPTSGSFQIYVDDDITYVPTIDAYSATTLWRQTTPVSPIYLSGTHTVKIRNMGGTYGNDVNIDAIQIIPVYDDSNALWTYTGTWTSYTGSGPLNNTRRYTATLNGTAAFSFNGPARFVLTYTKTATSDNFEVYVDDVYVTTLNAYSATTLWQQTYTSPPYLSGTHTMTIKNIGPSGKSMDVDAIQIITTSDTPPATITDLIANPGTSVGTVDLSWTALGGNNNTVGTDTAYLVRYSVAPITSSNWGSATAVTDTPPTPAAPTTAPTTTENMTVTGLTPGVTYYFAIRTQDTGPNLGDMSNSPSVVAPIASAPVGAGTYDDNDLTNWYYAGAWTALTGITDGPFSDTQHTTITPNNVAAISFTGPSNFILTYTKSPTGGSFAVYVDNVPATTISAYNATTLWKQTYISRLYSSGTHTVVIKNTGASGNVMDVDAIQIVTPADTTAPSAITTLAADPGTSAGTVNLSWTAPGNDDATGTAASYLVRYSTAPITSGNWTSATAVTIGIPAPRIAGTLNENMTVTGLMPGTNYYFAVRAQDATPNLGGVSNSPSVAATAPAPVSTGIYDDSNLDVWKYIGSWTTSTTSGPYLSALHTTSAPNNMAAFSFTGPARFILYYTKAATRGSFQIYVDNALLTTINAYSATTLWQQTYASPFYSTGTHTVVIKSISLSGKVVDLDAVQIVAPPGPGTYDDSNALWTYTGTWKTYSGAGPLNRTRHYTATLNGTAAFTFAGPARFTLYYTKTATSGKFGIYIDGKLATTINAYNKTTLWKRTYVSPYYLSGTHTVLIKNIVSGKYTDVDAIQIVAMPDVVPPSAITTLAADLGTSAGKVNLSWTTPGDDGTSGTATSYLVRYSAAPIDAGNWASAAAVTNGIPTPKAPGTAESMTVTGLIPGDTYYFAVRAQDETPNLSGMSNSPFATARALAPVSDEDIYDDTDSVNNYWYYDDNWASYTGDGPLNTTLHYTSTLNAIAAFSFSGPANFILTYSKGPNRGSFEVYVDGTLLTTVNAYSASALWRQTYTSPVYLSGTQVVIKNIGPSSKYIDVDAIQIITPSDTTPPSAITDLTAESGATIGSINLDWTAPGNDGTIGTATSYLVRYSTALINASNWASATAITADVPTPQVYGSSESMTVTGLMPSADYYFAIRALDDGPNLSDSSNSPSATAAVPAPVGANIYDDRDASWYYAGNWTNYNGTGPYASTLRTTTTPNDIAVFSFAGPAKFILTYSKGSTRTSFQVYVDNTLLTTINAYSATTLWKQTYASPFYSSGTHTVVVKHAGTSGKIVDVDAIQILEPPSPAAIDAAIYDDANALWTYTGSWTSSTGVTGPYAKTRRYTTTPDSTASFSFTGPARFMLYYAKTATSGSFEVYVDDVLETAVNAYNASTLWYNASTLPPIYTSQVYLSGAHKVTIKNISLSGSYVDVDAIQIISPEDVTDTTAPSAITDLAATSGTAIGAVDLSWTAPSDDVEVTSYLVRYSTAPIDAGNWASATEFTNAIVPQVVGNPETLTVTGLIPDTTYYFAVRALDDGPNLGGMSNSPSAAATAFAASAGAGTYEDSDPAWYYGNTWTLSGDLHTTSTLNDIAAFSFTGPAKFVLNYSKGPSRGSFEVYVDGALVTTISAYNATALGGQYTGPCKCDTDTHLVVIKNIGASAGVDSIQIVTPPVAGSTYDDADSLWTYTGSWTAATGLTGPYANTRHYTTTPNSAASFSFTGPAKFTLTYTTNSTSGSFQVYVDDLLVTTINAYSAATAWQQTYISEAYDGNPHTVTIKHDGPNNSASGTYIDVDAIEITSP